MHGGESSTFLNRWQTQKGPPNNNIRVCYAVHVHTKSKFTIDKYLFFWNNVVNITGIAYARKLYRFNFIILRLHEKIYSTHRLYDLKSVGSLVIKPTNFSRKTQSPNTHLLNY